MEATYDYVIVGAGSAGCVLAARLTEDPGTRVLLLEAGPPDDAPEIAMPGAATSLWQGPYAWDDTTVPQPNAAGRRIPWPRGRTLGGSSSINGTIYIRGNPLDFDAWRDVYGCAGWAYADLLPYFRRAEDQQHGESAFHGAGGPLRVEDPHYVHPLSSAWLDAAVAAGLPRNEDFNGARQDGVGYYQLTVRDGRRWSTADGYLRPALGRPNLHVETGAAATRVVLDGTRAVGVQYGDHVARADREVLLCGGAVNSPQLLLLSGIGPAAHLHEHGITPVVDAPLVGHGLQDHPACFVLWSTPALRNLWEEATAENLALWQEERRGPLASSGIEVGGFARSHPDAPAPDIQFAVAAAPVPPPLSDPAPPERMASMIVFALDIRSRGRVSLRSADPLTGPAIDPGYLTEPADLELLTTGVHKAREIAKAAPLADMFGPERAPGDEEIATWLRRTVTTIFHPVGSCAMGGDERTVCDPDLRVRGVDGLRVVDASVMPQIPRGNTNAPTIAIAERAADLIRGNSPGTR